MSPGKKIEIQTPEEEPEGWESLAEEASGGSLKPSAELEEALREAAEAVETPKPPAAGDEAPDAEASGKGGTPAEGASEEVALPMNHLDDLMAAITAAAPTIMDGDAIQ